MRRVLFIALALAACNEAENDPESSAIPVCPASSYLQSVVDPVRDQLEAAGKQLVDCTRDTADESKTCINEAAATGNGFVVEWSPAAEVQRAYIGGRNERGTIDVIRFERRSPFQQEWVQLTEACATFGPVAGCSEDRQDWCWSCKLGDAEPTYLCQDPEEAL